MLEEKINQDLTKAIKERNQEKIDAIRLIKSAIQIEKTKGKNHEIDDNIIIKLIQKLSIQHQETYENYVKVNNIPAAEATIIEKIILDKYLPKMLSEEELYSKIDHIIEESNVSTIKEILGILSHNYPNQYNGKIAVDYIKTKLK